MWTGNLVHNRVILIFIIFISFSAISKNNKVLTESFIICVFVLFKWTMDYHKCTISYMECKLRGVNKEEGYLYNFMEDLLSLNKKPWRHYVYAAVVVVSLWNVVKLQRPNKLN